MIETEAIRRLADQRLVPDRMRAAVESLEAMSGAEDVPVSDEEWASVVEHDQGFHAALVNTLNNKRLARMYASVQAENRLCLAQDRSSYSSVRQVAREHRVLLDAVGGKPPTKVVELLGQHLNEARTRLVALLGESLATGSQLVSDAQG